MNKGRKLALWGAWLQLGIVYGLIGMAVAMHGAFIEIAAAENSPQLLAEYISLALITATTGIIVALIGVVLLSVALFAYKYRTPWFFWFLIALSALYMISFPLGTIIGIVILVYIIPRKAEFCEDVPT